MRARVAFAAWHGERVRSRGEAIRVRRHAPRSVGVPQRPLGRQENSCRNVLQRGETKRPLSNANQSKSARTSMR